MLFLQLFIIQLVIFIGLVIFLRNILTRNVSRATGHLEKLSQEYSKKEEEINQILEKTRRDYNETLARAQSETNSLKEKLLKEMEELKDKILEEARLQSEEVIKKAERTRDAYLQEINQKIETKAVEKAGELIQQLLPHYVQKEMHLRWLEELGQKGLEGIDSKYFVGEVNEVRVKSAFSLTPEEREKLKGILKEKLRRNFKLEEEVDPSLVAGVIITAGSLVIDGSIRSKIQEAAKGVSH